MYIRAINVEIIAVRINKYTYFADTTVFLSYGIVATNLRSISIFISKGIVIIEKENDGTIKLKNPKNMVNIIRITDDFFRVINSL